MIFIDANIFLELQLNQEKAEECQTLLQTLEKGNVIAWTNSFLLFSMLMISERYQGIDGGLKFLDIIASFERLALFSPTFYDIQMAYELRKNTDLDFDDGLVLSSMKSLGIENLVTFDKHFSQVEGIRILTPTQATEITMNS